MTRVSRKTRDRLEIYLSELERWQVRTNLVSNATLGNAWTRHVEDGLQLLDHAPAQARSWVDLGTGGGSPGLVVAIALGEREGAHVDLVEANAKKCAFLRHVASLTKAPATVHDMRIERYFERARAAEVVSARALAGLAQLLDWAGPALEAGAIGLFPKGAGVEAELAEARQHHDFDADLLASRTDEAARIVRVTRYRGRADAAPS